MSAITIQDASKSYAGKQVLAGVDLVLHKGERVGLVGANGSGKTTLFRLILGQTPPDSGTITTTRGLTLAYLPQEPDIDENLTLIEAATEPFAEHQQMEADLAELSQQIAEAHGGAGSDELMTKYDRLMARFEAGGGYQYEVRIREVLGGLGFSPADYEQPVRVLSGGQKCRASLARMLMMGADYLLLDEPTNHLDINATRWLEKYLANYPGGVMVISHDRYLLDRVVTKIVEVEKNRVSVYPTNYTHYVEAKRIRRLQAERDYAKQAEWIAHQKEFIEKTRYRKDTAKQSRARQKLLANMEARGEILDKPEHHNAEIKLQFKPSDKAGDMVLRIENAGKAFDELRLFENLNFEMTVGEKVGIIGPNGVGKTTLLRMMLKQTPVDVGTVRLFENLSIGYYDQEHRDLNPDQSILDAVREIRPEASEGDTRSFLALFLFRGDDVFKRVGNLSGGEQSRVLLARLVWTSPQVLVLDEPTNHLDIRAREALEEALSIYPGSILMVSHDRYFLDKVATRLLVLPERTKFEVIEGNWSTYDNKVNQREEAARQAEETRKAAERKEREAVEKQQRKNKPKSRSKYAAQRLADIEAEVMALETRVEEIEADFANPNVLKDAARMQTLQDEYEQVKLDLDEWIEKWEDAVEAQGE